MSIFDRWRPVAAIAADQSPAERRPGGLRFDIGMADVDPALFGLPSWDSSWTGPAPKISRRIAMQVPGVKRARDIICQTIGTLPVEFIDAGNHVHAHPLLMQPEANLPRSITMINTLDDLLFEGVSVWRIVATDAAGYPVQVRRLEPGTVDLSRENKVYVKPDGSPQGTAWDYVPDAQIIRFYSPTDSLLEAGARAIRTAVALDTAASRYADDPMAQGYFRPTDGADPLIDEQGIGESDADYETREGNAIRALVLNWKRARQVSGTGYVPAGLEYVPLEWDPAQLQLAEGRQHAVLEIARVTGIDPEDLGVSTTSRTYATTTQKREELRDYTLNPFATAITDRLSMDDITAQHWRARVNFRSFIEADEKTRMETYVIARAAGAYGPDEVQRREQLPRSIVAPPPATITPAVPSPAGGARPAPVNHHAEPLHTTFGAELAPHAVGFPDAHGLGFAVDIEARTIFGLVVPYGATSALNRGHRYRFPRGSLRLPADQTRVKMRVAHGMGTEVAYAAEFTDSPEGMWGRFKVARGPEGDKALQMAADKVWDGLSVGLRPESTFDYSTEPATVIDGIVAEVSLTPDPSFTDSRVHAVTASNHDREDHLTMSTDTDPAPVTPPPAPVSRETDEPRVTFSAAELTESIIAAFGQLPPAQRPVIVGNPHGQQLQVNEPAPYRFDGYRGAHVFSTDLRDSLTNKDSEATARIEKFMELAGPQFNITQANAATINPNVNRPDLYVDQHEYEYPIWNSISKGGLTDNTPFVLPKFGTSSGLVADHTEGTEPTGGAFTTTAQTITPSPLSGKAVINREVWDQGGNPQLDTILWRQIVRAYYEGLEAAAVTFINAQAPTTITVTTAAADAALEASITSQLVPLQYIRGGNRFRDFKVQVDLMKALVAAKDTAGRKLFPVIGPQNASGTVSAFYSSVNIGGLIGTPAWALAASGSVSANSFLYDRGDISGWATAPRKLTMDTIAVATVSIGVWGYKALACTDLTGLRFVAYDPV
jgi:hypothetical protein